MFLPKKSCKASHFLIHIDSTRFVGNLLHHIGQTVRKIPITSSSPCPFTRTFCHSVSILPMSPFSTRFSPQWHSFLPSCHEPGKWLAFWKGLKPRNLNQQSPLKPLENIILVYQNPPKLMVIDTSYYLDSKTTC